MGMFNFGGGGQEESGQQQQAGGAGEQANGAAGQAGNGADNGTGESGQETNLNPWSKAANVGNEQSGQGQDQQQTTPNANGDGNQPGQNSNVDAFNNYVSGLNFAEGVDLAQAVADYGEGKHETLTQALNTVGANAFRQSMLMANQLMDKRIEKAVESAVEKSTGKVNSNLAFEKLEEALPYTADEATQPVARAVMTGFLKQGQDVKTAIKSTGKYFEQVLRNASANGLEIVPPGGQNNNRPGGASSYGGNDDYDWMDLLAGN